MHVKFRISFLLVKNFTDDKKSLQLKMASGRVVLYASNLAVRLQYGLFMTDENWSYKNLTIPMRHEILQRFRSTDEAITYEFVQWLVNRKADQNSELPYRFQTGDSTVSRRVKLQEVAPPHMLYKFFQEMPVEDDSVQFSFFTFGGVHRVGNEEGRVFHQSDVFHNISLHKLRAMVLATNQYPLCTVCKRGDLKLKKCSRCARSKINIYYCSSTCQSADWHMHRTHCRANTADH